MREGGGRGRRGGERKGERGGGKCGGAGGEKGKRGKCFSCRSLYRLVTVTGKVGAHEERLRVLYCGSG